MSSSTRTIIFWGNGPRGVACLQALLASPHAPQAVIVHPTPPERENPVAALATAHGLPVLAPADPNAPETHQQLRALAPAVSVLAGYGRILTQATIDLAGELAVNLHGGSLPQRRGSSPLNWALIDGADTFGLSVIRLTAGIDAGDVLLARRYPIQPSDTIRDLHAVANRAFPEMLLAVLDQHAAGQLDPQPQDSATAAYYPLRFPDDGFIAFDLFDAEQICNRIRALTAPYPGAFTYFGSRRVKLLAAAHHRPDYFGEPGRIYRRTDGRLLVAARDKCLWLTQAVFADDQTPVWNQVSRYAEFATLRGATRMAYERLAASC